MFVTSEMAGMGETLNIKTPNQAKKSGEYLVEELKNLEIVSNTGLNERREHIRKWTAEELVRAYMILRIQVINKGIIEIQDKLLLEAMEREGINKSGLHYNSIENYGELSIVHGHGLTTTNSRGETVAGWTKISIWRLL